jgi:hypothetical protein
MAKIAKKSAAITITLTEAEAFALFDVLEHSSNDIGDRLPDCEDDPEAAAIWVPMYDAAQRVMALIEAETTEQIIEGGAS